MNNTDIVFHQLKDDTVEIALAEGLKSEQRGDKGDDDSIAQTDAFLDKHRPQRFKLEAVSRASSIYGYAPFGKGKVIDITNGETVSIEDLAKEDGQAVVELTINPEVCYVSDLDAFDQVRKALTDGAHQGELERLSSAYWKNLIRLSDYEVGTIRRPEVMIPHDIAPEQIKRYNTKA